MKKLQTNVFLFLDDIREPQQAYPYTRQSMFIHKEWEIVRNFDEFKQHIETRGMPEFISFDHDLADSHYTPEYLWSDYEKSKEWQDAQTHTEKTGYECAKWLVAYCIENEIALPDYYCHSANPVGKDNIYNLLDKFKKVREYLN